MNESKKSDPRMLKRWDKSRALGTYEDSLLRPDHAVEDPLSQYRERFGQLKNEIMRRLGPREISIIFCSDTKRPLGGNSIYINKDGRWTVAFGIDRLGYLDKNVSLEEALQAYAIVTSISPSSKEIEENFDNKDGEFFNKLKAAKMSAIKDADDNPVPFATSLLASMEQRLGRLMSRPRPPIASFPPILADVKDAP